MEQESPHYSSEVCQLQIKLSNKKKIQFSTLYRGRLKNLSISQAPYLSYKFNRNSEGEIKLFSTKKTV